MQVYTFVTRLSNGEASTITSAPCTKPYCQVEKLRARYECAVGKPVWVEVRSV